MPTEMMFSGRVYTDYEQTRVPWYRYKCKAGSTVPGNIQKSQVQHTCKIVIDHPGEHRCICGHNWKNTSETATA